MGQGKQAKILSAAQVRAVLRHLDDRGSRYPDRDKTMMLLSVKAGLRAVEIASLTWSMVTNAEGEIGPFINLPNAASKGGANGEAGRSIPIHPELRAALCALQVKRTPSPADGVIHSERGRGYRPGAVAVWFHRLYAELGFDGASSHSGRRTFITNAARKIGEAGGSLRDVQELAGHASLSTTQIYIGADSEAKRKVIQLI